MFVSSALAAEHGTEAAAHGADVAHHGSMFADPTFWVGLAFLLVLAFIIWKAKNALFSALDLRAERIKTKIDEARQLKEEAQALLAEYDRKQRDAAQEAEAIVQHAKDEAERLKAKASEDLEASIKRREQQALERIATAEAHAAAEVRDLAVGLAVKATEAVLAEKMSAQKANALIDDAIKDLPNRLH